jgi:predicted O-methyltransferase YrrM
MTGVLIGLVASLSIMAGVFGYYALAYKARRKQRGLFGSWPIRTIPLEQLDPVFKHTPFGPGRETEVRFVGQGSGIPGGTSDTEAWVLAVLATRARSMFEFGTCTGKTTYLWARNAPASSTVVTITLAPDQVETYHGDRTDDARDTRHALKESAYETFYYSGTDVEPRIEQLFGDSKAFDESQHLGRYDLIFVDGSHAHSYVVSDSEKAIRMCASGGLILWHDYAGRRHSPGVYQALNELSRRIPLVHVAGTTFMAYRKPTA